jgi:hypothetical protein
MIKSCRSNKRDQILKFSYSAEFIYDRQFVRSHIFKESVLNYYRKNPSDISIVFSLQNIDFYFIIDTRQPEHSVINRV